MNTIELLLIAVGLSMDAFAVSVCKGLSLKKVSLKHLITAGIWFGGFQALMPLLGYLSGSLFTRFVERYSHWIAFLLLTLIGANMIREAVSEDAQESSDASGASDASMAPGTMLLLAIATSIDAFAVGVTLAFLNVNLLGSVLTIGCTTFLFSAAGVKIGSIFGTRWRKSSSIAGGVILIILGIKILLENIL